MLRFLKISHFAVIDAVEVEFEPGFNVLTGETGAGKSILGEAVGLLLGDRASGDLVRTGEDAASIEAIFESDGEELVVRREITSQGRSRAFVNGALATAGALKDLSGRLIELHGQHEHQTLLDPATHLDVLDTFGRLDSLLAPTRAAFEAMRAAGEELARVRQTVADRDARLELVAFQVEERLALLERLKRKYGPTLGDVIARRDALRRELSDLEGGDERIAQLERDHSAARAAYLAAAEALGKERRRGAAALSRQLERLLAELAMERTRFEVRFSAT